MFRSAGYSKWQLVKTVSTSRSAIRWMSSGVWTVEWMGFARIHCLHLIYWKLSLPSSVPVCCLPLVADELRKGHSCSMASNQRRFWWIRFSWAPLTMPAHQVVGSSTCEITPSDSILSSSWRTSSRNGNGTNLGVHRLWGLASGFSLISYSSPRFPSPWKRDGYFSFMLLIFMASTLTIKFKVVMADSPSRFLRRPFTTKARSTDLFAWDSIPVNHPLTSKVRIWGYQEG